MQCSAVLIHLRSQDSNIRFRKLGLQLLCTGYPDESDAAGDCVVCRPDREPIPVRNIQDEAGVPAAPRSALGLSPGTHVTVWIAQQATHGERAVEVQEGSCDHTDQLLRCASCASCMRIARAFTSLLKKHGRWVAAGANECTEMQTMTTTMTCSHACRTASAGGCCVADRRRKP